MIYCKNLHYLLRFCSLLVLLISIFYYILNFTISYYDASGCSACLSVSISISIVNHSRYLLHLFNWVGSILSSYNCIWLLYLRCFNISLSIVNSIVPLLVNMDYYDFVLGETNHSKYYYYQVCALITRGNKC